ncbi:MAG: hypothetical protein MUC41_01905 [Syntrophobacteraceae bacterium]|jgi:formylmethanofuran dehydrogenase subunit E|nr:hypothetical protein [Syntrophobacteraceae bacterium]
MNCKACGKEMAAGEGRQVAQWTFCEACFEELLEPRPGAGTIELPESSGTSPSDLDEAAASGASTGADDTNGCHLCGKALTPGAGWRLGPWLFCEECRRDLSVTTSRPTDQEEVEAEEPGPAASSHQEDEAVPLVIQTRLSLGRTALCGRCGKRILERAGKVFEGELLCPDCYYSTPVSSPPALSPSPSEAVAVDLGHTEERPSLSPGECDCCGKSVPADRLEVRSGFSLCSACLATDGELALEISQGRHRKRMEELRTRFVSRSSHGGS